MALDLTEKGRQTALNMMASSKRPVEDAKQLIARFRDGQDTYSIGLVQGAKEFLKGKV